MDILGYLEAIWSYFQTLGALIAYVMTQLGKLMGFLTLPFSFFFNFLKSFISSALSTPATASNLIPESIVTFFNSIPMWATITAFITVALYGLALFYILDQLKHL